MEITSLICVKIKITMSSRDALGQFHNTCQTGCLWYIHDQAGFNLSRAYSAMREKP